MGIDFSNFIKEDDGQKAVEPRDIFGSLPYKPNAIDYLRGPQDQVLDKWWGRRSERDLTIKMNTGGGKTIVGLLIAQSSLTEGIGPVVYLVPDHYLATQVLAEGKRLGIAVTDSEEDFNYARGNAILVAVFQKLFNGKSVFGVEGSRGRTASAAAPKTVIIDDVHACLERAEQAFRMVVPRDNDVYTRLLEEFKDAIKQQSPSVYLDLEENRPQGVQQIPFWAWKDKQDTVLTELRSICDDEQFKFVWPLLVDVLPLCNAVFTSNALEIEAPALNCDAILGFRESTRRIYLTATLSDDGVLVRNFGADARQVSQAITPANAGDIGDRLILVPQQSHPHIATSEIRALIVELSQTQNVAIIVPSRKQANEWSSDATMVLDKSNLSEGVAAMQANPNSGLYVFVNRYDGVDLPGDACHILVIDGLPEGLSGIERVDFSQLSGTGISLAQQVQRIEQGMGRATRSSDDYCVVFLLGSRLAERLYSPDAQTRFSPATRAQIRLSAEVSDSMVGSDAETLNQVLQQCLNRDPSWLKASRTRLATVRYDSARVSAASIGSRDAFGAAVRGDWNCALNALQEAINKTADVKEKAYLKQRYAAYQHHVNPTAAQETQKSANRDNHNLLRPMEGVQYSKLSDSSSDQGMASSSFMREQFESTNELVMALNALLDDLVWSSRTNAFEQAWADLAKYLGFASQRPERDVGHGPDVLWAVGNGKYYVVEAKSGASDSHPVYKNDAKQLSNSMDWFYGIYMEVARATPVLIHPSARFDRQAGIPAACRVVTAEKLDSLRSAMKRFIVELAEKDAFRYANHVTALLNAHQLNEAQFLRTYSSRGTST